ncbi:hypothetical protein P7K49_000846 [Saguinus oedipus]|uniref:Alpha-D-phosphohexomutase alpha/beta/alpha domain-containing protein n=1 Tax=Saguinus oedipus TaxID=9490 RepID=A0ABQ9WDE1_SAGOE|nr:hypothetical protein P7K49_000846 [Saguinus oedipus]
MVVAAHSQGYRERGRGAGEEPGLFPKSRCPPAVFCRRVCPGERRARGKAGARRWWKRHLSRASRPWNRAFGTPRKRVQLGKAAEKEGGGKLCRGRRRTAERRGGAGGPHGRRKAGAGRTQGSGWLGKGPGREAESRSAARLVGAPQRATDFLGLQEPQQDRPGGDMEGSPIPVLTVPTAPYEDQRPAGGGGLRRPTGLFEGQRNYLPNFIQSVLSSIDLRDRQGCTMVVGSDGRYFSKTATEIVVQMAAANGVSE